jgi:protein FRG1
MPDETPVRSSKLKFKGEKTKKKRKREDGDDSGSSRKRRDEEEHAPDTWVQPENPTDIRGPTFLFHASDPSPICVTYDATRARVALVALDKDGAEVASEVRLLDRVPSDVSQVWVTTRVAGSPTINLCVLRTLCLSVSCSRAVSRRTGTGEGKFMSSDKHGIVSADSDARGPQEEWTPVVLPDGMVCYYIASRPRKLMAEHPGCLYERI